MNKSVVAVLIACGVFAGTAREASAQTPWSDRGYINVGWGVESGSSTMTDTRTSTIYEEPATVTTTSAWTSGSLFDVGVGLRVYRNLTVGVGYHQEQNDTDGQVTGSIPSPIFFNKPRTLSGSEPLDRKEMATHLVIGWVIPFNSKLDVMVFGGPSFFRLTQDVISDVKPNESQATSSTIAATTTKTERAKSITGFNAGVDATYIVWSNDSVRLGAGGFVRFTQASTDVQMLDAGSAQPTDVGGVQFGFGGRIRF
jgi:hypothetical protein